MQKKLILITSPPACGKTTVAKALAERLRHVVYLDKDTLIVLSKQIFAVAGQPCDRSSAFFKKNIRDCEYQAILALALEALAYDDIVLINAPFAKEVRDEAFLADLRGQLAQKGARLYVVWVVTAPEVCHQRMIARGSDRDTWKLANWEEYLAGCDFSIPHEIEDATGEQDLLLFYNSTAGEFACSLRETVNLLEEKK